MLLKLSSLLVLVTISAVSGERFYFAGICSNYDNRVDPLLHTNEGWLTFQKLMKEELHMVLWDPSMKESDLRDITVKISDDNVMSYTYYDGSGNPRQTITGDVTFEKKLRNKYFVVNFNTAKKGDSKGMFGSDGDDMSDLYPVYISEYEVILAACNQVFLGKIEMLYVLNSDPVSLKDMDMNCAKDTVKEFTNIDVVQLSAYA